MPHRRERCSDAIIPGERSQAGKFFNNQDLFTGPHSSVSWPAARSCTKFDSARKSPRQALRFMGLGKDGYPRRSASASLKPVRTLARIPRPIGLSEAFCLGLIEAMLVESEDGALWPLSEAFCLGLIEA